MKGSIEILKQALEMCAKAHKVGFNDYSDEGQFSLNSVEVPVVADMRSILSSIVNGGMYEIHVDHGWGFTEVFLYGEDECETFKDEVDVVTLGMALPDGWIERIAA